MDRDRYKLILKIIALVMDVSDYNITTKGFIKQIMEVGKRYDIYSTTAQPHNYIKLQPIPDIANQN